jgi:hypothetical protein
MFINLPKSTLRSVLIQLLDLDWVALTVQLAQYVQTRKANQHQPGVGGVFTT